MLLRVNSMLRCTFNNMKPTKASRVYIPLVSEEHSKRFNGLFTLNANMVPHYNIAAANIVVQIMAILR